jgi:hypothetical protein
MLKKKPLKGGAAPSGSRQVPRSENGQVKNREAGGNEVKKKSKEKRKVQDIEADEGQVGGGEPSAEAVKKNKTSAEPQKKSDVGIIGVASGCQVIFFWNRNEKWTCLKWFDLAFLFTLIKV